MLARPGLTARLAVGDSLSLPDGGTAVTCGDANATAKVKGGRATLTSEQLLALAPTLGTHALDWDGTEVTIERVGAHYATRADLVAYGVRNGDDFGDTSKYSVDAVCDAIQAAEEAIDAGTGRRFCASVATVALGGGGMTELPVQDATAISVGLLASDRQAMWWGDPATATVEYGAPLDARIRQATVQLAASYLRPRSQAENVRGQSVDGVYVSYTLATGDEGAWTGLPFVDAVIEEHRSRRVVVM